MDVSKACKSVLLTKTYVHVPNERMDLLDVYIRYSSAITSVIRIKFEMGLSDSYH